MPNPPETISDRLKTLNTRILIAAKQACRSVKDITLVAVSKTKPISTIKQALTAGQIDFGENYVQEWREKHTQLADKKINWHLIGSLQTNKVKYVVGKVSLIHTLDRLELALAINKQSAKLGLIQNCLVQVKMASEDTKSGCTPDKLLVLIDSLAQLKNINICGLMTIGSLASDPVITAREFKTLKELRDQINQKELYRSELAELSMGMSHDFELAIEHGATLIRVGSRIFGQRI